MDIAIIWFLFNFFSTVPQKIGKMLTLSHKRNVKYPSRSRRYLGKVKRIQIYGWLKFGPELSLFLNFFIGCKPVQKILCYRDWTWLCIIIIIIILITSADLFVLCNAQET
jgi:hypothetical protein